jgi:hypothetical protein
MERQQEAGAIGIHHPGRSRQMARSAGSQQAIGMEVDESDGVGRHRRLDRVERGLKMVPEQFERGARRV